MKNIFYRTLLVWSIVLLAAACKKNKGEEKTVVTGYYQGYIQASTGGSILNIGILHRENGTSRLYQFPSNIGDTTQVNNDTKVDGVWSLNGSTYHCIFSKNNYTVTFDATVATPGSAIAGNFTQSGAGTIGGTFVLNKK